METSKHRVRHRDQQEVRHDHHAFHRPQHVDHDPRPLRPDRDVELCPGQSEHGIHRHIHQREYSQDIRAQAILFQGAVECV